MVTLITSAEVNSPDVNCRPDIGASIEAALKLLSNKGSAQVPVAGTTFTDTDLRPSDARFFAITPNQYELVEFRPLTKKLIEEVLPMTHMLSPFNCTIS